MTTMNIAETKSKLSELVARAETGEEVVISWNGKPRARLHPLEAVPRREATLGTWDHLGIRVPDHIFFGPDPDVADFVDAPIDPTRW